MSVEPIREGFTSAQQAARVDLSPDARDQSAAPCARCCTLQRCLVRARPMSRPTRQTRCRHKGRWQRETEQTK
eukprot:scaffold193391_cov32-Tisochrysis_lutea.AAC.3